NFKSDTGNTLARIIGQSYRSKFESRKMYSFYKVPDKNYFNLGLIHTQLNPDNSRYVPVSQTELKSKDDIHYWALGHIHQPLVLNRSTPALVYSGTPQGHNISEVGVKGCFIVEANIKNPEIIPQLQFVPTSNVIYKKIEVDISEEKSLKTLSDLQKLLLKRAEVYLNNIYNEEIDFLGLDYDNVSIDGKAPVKGLIIRWVITGHGPLHKKISSNQDEAEVDLKNYLNKYLASPGVRPFAWTHSIKIRTTRELPDLEEIKGNEIYQEVEKIIQEIFSNSELETELLREWGSIWEGEEDHENRDNDSFYPDSETKQEIIEAAREQIIAYLFTRGEDV
ncbi:MAG: metallophosphoesterase family protein, partial [Halanaerobium sp.]